MKTISQAEFFKKLSNHARANDIPMNGLFELTPFCNLNCKMCYIHLTDAALKTEMLSGKQWISIMQQAIDHGMVSALLTGGEAMTHPDFWEIYEFLISKGVLVRIKTNGILLNESTIQKLCLLSPSNIDISLYGCNSESYLAVTGYDVFDAVISNIQAAKKAGLPLKLMVTPSRYMLPWAEDIMKLAKRLDILTIVNETLLAPNENTERKLEDYDLTKEEYLKIAVLKNELFPNENPVSDDECPEPDKKTSSVIPDNALRCGAGRANFAVHWNGIMTPCLAFPQEMVCEDLKKTTFTSAWESINQQIKKFVIAKECLSCDYRNKCGYCPVKHGKYALEHLINPKYCELKKAFIDI